MKNYSIYVSDEIGEILLDKGVNLSPLCKIGITPKEEVQHFVNNFKTFQKDNSVYLLPTAEQVCGWLREHFGIIIDVNYYFDMSDTPHFEENTFEWDIEFPLKESDRSCGNGFSDTYNEALLTAIRKALELI